MPLYEILGVTSTDKTYSIGFSFLTSEKNENFSWDLQMLLDLLKSKDNMPKVIVTDKDTTLMNDVAVIFPKSTTILCQFHARNVRAKCIKYYIVKSNDVKVDGKDKQVNEVKSSKLVYNIMKLWDSVVESPSKESYVDVVVQFRDTSKKFP
jgi:hypothetical protein